MDEGTLLSGDKVTLSGRDIVGVQSFSGRIFEDLQQKVLFDIHSQTQKYCIITSIIVFIHGFFSDGL